MRSAWIRLCVAASVLGLGPLADARTARQAAPAPADLAWQIALDRAGFSPGVIDGKIGSKTRLATREFQQARALPATGALDEATAAALGVEPDKALAPYTVQAADLAQVGPLPRGWVEKSRLPRLPYPSLDEVLAERFHCTRALLARLNPGRDIRRLAAGDTLQAPAVGAAAPASRGERLDVNLTEKVIRVFGGDGKLVGLFFCSVAADKAKLPSGQASVAVTVDNPSYTFDPAKWPEVKDVKEKLTIPPGPRNPVGLCWIGLSLPGYGMHGSPTPELIGKTGSHGCFRLANWDAIRLSRMIRIGTPVTFSASPAPAAKAHSEPAPAKPPRSGRRKTPR